MIRAALLLLLALSSPAWALSRPTFQPAPDARVDTSLVFAEASGARRPLGAILGGKPAILLIGYNKCPNLCGLTQNIVADALTTPYQAVRRAGPLDGLARDGDGILGRGGVEGFRVAEGGSAVCGLADDERLQE